MTKSTDDHPWSDWLRPVVPALFLGALAFVAWRLGVFQNETNDVAAAAARLGGRAWVAPAFILVYAALATLALPTTALSYSAGALFGFGRGSLYVWVASMGAAVAGYWLARGGPAGLARRMTRKTDLLRHIRRGNAAVMSARLQLAPWISFGMATYAAGVAKLDPRSFLLGTALGITPGTLVSAYLGSRLVEGIHGHRGVLWLTLGVPLALMVLSFVPIIIR